MTLGECERDFDELAKKEMELALSKLPTDSMGRSAVFLEQCRAFDYWTARSKFVRSDDSGLLRQEFDVLSWGWNTALARVFVPLSSRGLPAFTTSRETESFATSVLMSFGRSVLMERVSQMVRARFLSVSSKDNEYVVQSTGVGKGQYLDNLEWANLDAFENALSGVKKNELWGRWQLAEYEWVLSSPKDVGSYLALPQENPYAEFLLDNIKDRMKDLVFPWDSGKGIMVGYDAAPEVDWHFFAIASDLITKWQSDAGFHPNTKFLGVPYEYLLLVVVVIVSLHIKHIQLVLVGKEKHPEVSLFQSFTIWKSKEELLDTVSSFVGLSLPTIRKTIDLIAMTDADINGLSDRTTPFLPLLIDLGNDQYLCPISSLNRNPLDSVLRIAERRNPRLKNEIMTHREDWLRKDVYAMFGGTRYKCVDGNVKIRRGAKVVTDIDGAIFDRVSGELALFQFKWQDYHINDVAKLRSRTKNLSRELVEWSEKVDEWIRQEGIGALAKTLRLKLGRFSHKKVRVYCFGISRMLSRVNAYGYSLENANIAVSNFPQFIRIRTKLGPTRKVFSKLFTEFKLEASKQLEVKPLPFTARVAGTTIHFEDLWNGYESEKDEFQGDGWK